MTLPELTKRYYTIAEVATLFDVAKSLLRYWESEFDTIKPIKGRNGVRRYTAKEVEKIRDVYELVKERGFTIEGAKKELSKKKQSKKVNDPILESRLMSLKEKLISLRNQL